MNMPSIENQKLLFGYVIINMLLAVGGSIVQEMNLPEIKDLFAEAVIYDRHSLQLKVTWNSSTVKDANIDVHVKPLKNEHCYERLCFEYGLRPTIAEILLPKDPNPLIEHKECSVEPGCAYEILVEAPNRKIFSNITYKVPDCVIGKGYEVCACHHKSQLPNVSVTAKIDASNLKIFYNVTALSQLPNDINVDSILISVRKQNNPSLPWEISNMTVLHEPLHNANRQTKINGKTQISLDMPSAEGSRYSIRAHVVDTKGCEGKDGNFSINVPISSRKDLNHSDNVSYTKIFAIITPVFVVVLAIIFFVQKFIKRAKKTQAIQNWLGVYHHVPSGSNILPHIVMQENLLYVDKDILEARSRGDADYLEIPHSCLTIGKEIGKGAFGRVFIARAYNLFGKPGSQIVAVKQLRKNPTQEDLEEFHSEIEMMKSVSRHPNIVSLLACCTIKQPLLMIMEYVGCGDLLNYLREVRDKHRPRPMIANGIFTNFQAQQELLNQNHITLQQCQLLPNGKYLQLLHSTSTSASDASYITQSDTVPAHVRPSVTETMYTMLSHNPDLTSSSHSSLEYVLDHKELHNFATQIARGMDHLEERQITHRDLAARNILITENKVLKISDFGLSRNGIYVNTRSKKLPVKWLSIEALRDHLFSSKSDVWAFGIVLWEIGTLGGHPYPDLDHSQILPFLMAGQRLNRPEICSEKLYDLMMKCWLERPEDRPPFSEIVAYLEPPNQKIYVDFNEIRSDYVFPPTKEQLLLHQKSNGLSSEAKLRH